MSAIPEPVIFEFYLGVNHCEPGKAYGCDGLNNRGLDLGYEVTVWPRRQHYRLTTGAESRGMGAPCPVRLNEAEKQMCAILGLNELELGIFLRSWLPNAATWPGKKPELTDKAMRHYLKCDAATYEIGDYKK